VYIVVYKSTDTPIKEVVSDLTECGIVVYAVPTSKEIPPLTVQLKEELAKTSGRGPGVVHWQVKMNDGDIFDSYTYGVVSGFGEETAAHLVKEALMLWRQAGAAPRFVAELDD
jgi:hypothetical protein